jgi:hypothetical protein
LVAVFLLAASGDLGLADTPISCADADVLGRIVDESYTELPETPGRINLAAWWSLRVKFEKVIAGYVPDRVTTVSVVSDPAIPKNMEFHFHLKRISRGHYQWKQSERDCGG